MEKRRYNSLLFDVDDTLIDYKCAELGLALKVLENHSLPHSPDVAELFEEINDWHTFELGREITAFDVVVNRFARLLKLLEVKGELLDEMLDEYFTLMQNNHKLKPGALKTLRYLRDRGYSLYITSNGYKDFQYKRIKSARIAGFFNKMFFSEEIDIKKPSPKFFDIVMSHIPESNRSKVLIIGDAPTADILGGINAKIDTCWIAGDRDKCKYKYTYKVKKIDELLNIL